MRRTAGFFFLSVHFSVLIFFLVGLPFSGGAAEPEGSKQDSPQQIDLNQAVASVNGVPISARELIRELGDRVPQTGHETISNERLGELRNEILDGLIIKEVLVQEARKEKIKVSQKDVEAEMRGIEKRFPSPEAYQQALLKRGMSTENIREGVERHLLIRELTQKEVHSRIKISRKDMKAYYEGHREQFVLPEQIRLRIILIPVAPESTKGQWEEALKKAEGLVEKARAGEDFKSLVRDFSGDERIPEDREGDTGLLHQGRLPYTELEGLVFKEETGSVGGPVQSLYGYLVFRVEEKKPSQQLEFEQLNEKLLEKELRRSETEKKLKLWIEGLREKADIKVF